MIPPEAPSAPPPQGGRVGRGTVPADRSSPTSAKCVLAVGNASGPAEPVPRRSLDGSASVTQTQHENAAAARWALLAGNFAIGCGVMVTAGSLNDLVRSLQVSVPVAGQLVSAAALTMAFGAPLLAAAVAGWDRRRLLALALVWYAAGHLLSALAPDFALLLPLRAASVIGAAVFTPQAAAAINVMVPGHERGRAFAFIFLGWSLASVIGMPLSSFIGETLGWRWAFALVALLSALAAAGVWRSLPDGIRPPAMNLASWRGTLTSPSLMAVVLVTAFSSAGQFSLFAYLAPYYRVVLGADPAQVSLLFLCFGAFGLLGNLLLSRWIDRLGATACVNIALASMALSLLMWPWPSTLPALVIVMAPWALGCFSSNSAQQARLGQAGPAVAPALMALNTSAMYAGQALGASGGGASIAASGGLGSLHLVAFAWMVLAIVTSAGVGWQHRRLAPGAAES